MSSHYLDDRSAASFPHQPLPENPLWSAALALLAGAYILFKAAELFGFPVWLWFYQFVDMVLYTRAKLGSRIAGSGESAMQDSASNTASGGGKFLSSLGLNSTGLLKKGVQGVTKGWATSHSNTPAGLYNPAMACYQNSVIQGLTSLSPLQSYLSTAVCDFQKPHKTTAALYEISTTLNSPANLGRHFVIQGPLRSMNTYTQQDAHEYFDNIMSTLQEELKRELDWRRRSQASLVSALDLLNESPLSTAKQEMSPFPTRGFQAQRVGCRQCGYCEGLMLLELSSGLTVQPNNSIRNDVRECIDDYTQMDVMQDIDCPNCTLMQRKKVLLKHIAKTLENNTPVGLKAQFDQAYDHVTEALDDEQFDDNTLLKKCNIKKDKWIKGEKSKQIAFSLAPAVLPIHINRSVFINGYPGKNRARIDFPEELDLGPWMLPYPAEPRDKWRMNPHEPLIPGLHPQESWKHPIRKVLYDLRAVVKHSGTADSGHYVCFKKQYKQSNEDSAQDPEPKDAQELWWACDDETVTQVSEDVVFGNGTGRYARMDVFMLFYEKKPDGEDPLPVEPEVEDALIKTFLETVLEVPDVRVQAPKVEVEAPEQFVVEEDNIDMCWDDFATHDVPPPPPLPAEDVNSVENSSVEAASIGHPSPASEDMGTEMSEADLDTDMSEEDSSNTSQYEPDTEMSDTDTLTGGPEGTPSTQYTSEDEADMSSSKIGGLASTGATAHNLQASRMPTTSPHMMRAGDDSRGLQRRNIVPRGMETY